MNVTGTGIFIMLLALLAIHRRGNSLFLLLIFFLPFSATSVINVGSGSSGSAIQPFMFINTLLIGQNFFKGNNFLFRKNVTNILFYFLLVALLSLIMPIYINGTEYVNLTTRLDGSYSSLGFSTRNITQFLYLCLGIFSTYIISDRIKTSLNFMQVIRVYSYSILFVIIWGGIELFCKSTGLHYPDEFFNNSISESAKGYLSTLDNGTGSILVRISSVGVEPSIIVQCVLILIPFYFQPKNITIFSKRKDKLFLVLMIGFVLVTTSSTGVVSLGFSILIFNLIKSKNKLSFFLSFVFISISCWVAFELLLMYFAEYINATLLGKLDSYSAQERFKNIRDSWNLFAEYPILGVGWGSVQSYDLIVKLLSNVGVVGLFIFSLFIVQAFKKLSNLSKVSFESASLTASLSVFLFSNLISGFAFVFGHTWFLLGIVLAFIKISLNNKLLNQNH